MTTDSVRPQYGFVEVAGYRATVHLEGNYLKVTIVSCPSNGQHVQSASSCEDRYRDTIQASMDIMEATLRAFSHHEFDPTLSYYLGEVSGDYRPIHQVGKEGDVTYIEGRYGSSMPVVRANDVFQQTLIGLGKLSA